MNLEEYRLRCGWSKKGMARRADMDFGTIKKALDGESISMRSASKLATTISEQLGQTVHVRDIEGLNAS